MIATTQPKIPTLKPIVRWAGNKYGTPVADRVAELFSPFRSTHLYVDPFAGALGMGLHLMPSYAVFVDYSKEMITLHKWIKSGGSVNPALWPEHSSKDQFFAYRSEFRQLQAGAREESCENEFTIRLLWLLQHCHNGLWRNNRRGLFNVPSGGNKGKLLNRSVPDLSIWSSVYNSNQWWFFQGDFQDVDSYVAINSWSSSHREAFIYCDPPYLGTHSAYNANGFSWNDQVRLADWLAAKDCPVAASNSNHPDIVELYQRRGFEVEFIEVARSMSPKGDRKPAIEMLAYRGMNG